MGTLATGRIAVGVFDRSLHVAVSNNGVGKGNSVSETATPVYKRMENHCQWKKNNNTLNKI